jgi:hypothetical protein
MCSVCAGKGKFPFTHYYLIGEGKTKTDVEGGKVGEGQAAMAMFACFFRRGGTTPIRGVIQSLQKVTFMKLVHVRGRREVLMHVYTSTLEEDVVAHVNIMKFCRQYCLDNAREVSL